MRTTLSSLHACPEVNDGVVHWHGNRTALYCDGSQMVATVIAGASNKLVASDVIRPLYLNIKGC